MRYLFRSSPFRLPFLFKLSCRQNTQELKEVVHIINFISIRYASKASYGFTFCAHSIVIIGDNWQKYMISSKDIKRRFVCIFFLLLISFLFVLCFYHVLFAYHFEKCMYNIQKKVQTSGCQIILDCHLRN